MYNQRIGIIIVLYNNPIPDLSNLLNKNNLIIIVDNSPKRILNVTQDYVSYIPLKKNVGIAAAQNIGINEALNNDCSHIIFLDQDSRVSPDFIPSLISQYKKVKSNYTNLFALGPTPINGRTNKEYKPAYRVEESDNNGFVCKSEIISSGACVEASSIQKVGFLNESLFIDYVDNEWFWRARQKGYICGITRNVSMTHYIGQQDIFIMNYPLRISSPIRYYYQCRNYLWLVTESYVPGLWKRNSFVKLFILPVVFPFKIEKWLSIYTHILRGIKDGILKRYLFKKQ